MFSYFLFVFGFVMEGGTFGANLINAFEWVLVYYYVVATIVFFFLAIFLIAISSTSFTIKEKTIAYSIFSGLGGILSLFVLVWILLAKTIIHYIDPAAQSWSDLSTNAQFLIIFWFVLTLIVYIKNKMRKEEEKKELSNPDKDLEEVLDNLSPIEKLKLRKIMKNKNDIIIDHED